ncbi:MAG TPA: aspartate/glutamate racemase family protein [Lysinibacillus sp.]|uniref:aspartate/glutamate racemase family protein n=1 Tax=Lysinibacillus TaxID=400634 RepID=UPI000738BB26|nr:MULTISPECIES: aspartate/glutamate racemase family protein [unclassified Lysinibacillus]MEE3809624.1 aspartate/glutamate racemase family protein [Lysinibacillus fusiformis]HBT72972.1 aspartate/glutamate racemase family protein [Lysinibacillus sp.]KUF29801.1 aspartate racemase [Lysinibacillus sp. F5]WCH49409.1 aspartate/glutamate racemase family protein [Lysinibacillus sp. OF-1]SCY18887.1 aspartate racemase [Lysinibacillus sp. SG9]
MKTIGLIGGMSWESSAAYYRLMNEQVKQRLGGLHSAKCILYSVDFQQIEHFQAKGEWDKAGNVLAQAAQSLERAGADFVIICTNTMHKVIDIIEAAITIPILHIADATARQIKEAGLQKIALLGTKYTMEQAFYKARVEGFGIEVIVPDSHERMEVNRIIYEELCLGIIKQDAKSYYIQVVEELVQAGAQGVILGCTEIGLLIQQEDISVPVFDTAAIHAQTAVSMAIQEEL